MGANSPGSSRLDGSEALENLFLPYDRRTKELDDTPRIVDGQDVWVTPRGTIAKRPAIRTEDWTAIATPGKAVRLWLYKTLENPAKIYVLGCFTYNETYYSMYYFRVGTSSAWTSLGNLRALEYSTKPHEVTVANGKAYIKGFPTDDTQRLGTVNVAGGLAVFQVPSNGNFEVGALTGWSSTGSGNTDSVIAGAKRSGTYGLESVLVGASDGGRAATVLTGTLPTVGDKFTVHAWVNVVSGTPTAKLSAAISGGNSGSATTTSTTGFEELTVELENNTAATLTISLVGSGTGTLYWDDVYITRKERLGGVVFDGTDTTTHYWGLLPPTQAEAPALTSSGGWTAASNVTVNFGWRYSYSWKTSTGQLSSRAPLKIPVGQGQRSGSDTGAFTNKKPTVTVQGASNLTLIPEVVIWRTFDGGGVFPRVETITNTGDGSINYEDNDSEGTAGQPKTDFELNSADLAPFSTINSPPPTVVTPLVTGTDPISTATSNVVEYAGRIWYFIGNILVFSGNEEVSNGIPQECFPSGVQGNFIRFKNPGRLLAATSEALYIFTDETVMWITGSTREDFRVDPLLTSIGAAENQPAAVCSARDVVAWLTDDNEIAMLRGKNLRVISGPLGTDLKSLCEQATSTNPVRVHIVPHFQDGQAWLFVGLEDITTPANSRIWVYDLARDAWNPPWVVEFCSMVSGRVRESDNKRELIIATLPENWSGSSVGLLDFDAFTDQLADGGSTEYAPSLTTNLFKIPAGNHINLLSRKGAKPVLRSLVIERTKYSSDTNPTVQYRLDEFSGSWSTPPAGPSPPTPTAQHTSFYELYYDIGSQATRAQIKISKSADAERFELQTIGFLWDAPAGS